MTLIANKLYIIENRFSSKTLKPISNSSAAGIVIATRDNSNIGNFLFRAEAYGASSPTWWRLKHEASGLYLNSATGADNEQLTIAASGNIVFDITPYDTGYSIRPLAAPFSYLNVDTNSENAAVDLAGGPNNINQLFDILDYTPVNINTPTVSTRVFRHYTTIPVSGVVAGAIVRVYKNGQLISTVTDTEYDGTLDVPVSGLSAGDILKVTQESGGVVSAESVSRTVRHFGKVRQTAESPDKFQAYEMLVSDATSDNIQDWTGPEGEPIGPVRDSEAAAQADLTNANFTLTSL